jgi:hypothetical protein
MGHLPNEADLMPLGGHPMREVRLTPWAPIRKPRSNPTTTLPSEKSGHNDKQSLLFSPFLFVRVETLSTINNIDLFGL